MHTCAGNRATPLTPLADVEPDPADLDQLNGNLAIPDVDVDVGDTGMGYGGDFQHAGDLGTGPQALPEDVEPDARDLDRLLDEILAANRVNTPASDVDNAGNGASNTEPTQCVS